MLSGRSRWSRRIATAAAISSALSGSRGCATTPAGAGISTELLTVPSGSGLERGVGLLGLLTRASGRAVRLEDQHRAVDEGDRPEHVQDERGLPVQVGHPQPVDDPRDDLVAEEGEQTEACGRVDARLAVPRAGLGSPDHGPDTLAWIARLSASV